MLLCEHNPVYTFGLREAEEHRLKSKELQKLGAQVFKVMVQHDSVYGYYGNLFRIKSLRIKGPVENTENQLFFFSILSSGSNRI